MKKINPNKAHRFNVNESFWSFHTTAIILAGTLVTIGSVKAVVKRVIRDRPSIYHEKHYYYEVETT